MAQMRVGFCVPGEGRSHKGKGRVSGQHFIRRADRIRIFCVGSQTREPHFVLGRHGEIGDAAIQIRRARTKTHEAVAFFIGAPTDNHIAPTAALQIRAARHQGGGACPLTKGDD
jgi:hypothetical protein